MERTRRGRIFRARAGEMLNWGTAPFGYRYVKHERRGGHAEIDETEAQWVRKAFDWLLVDGVGTTQIARRLTEAGVKPRFAKHWYASTVRELLRHAVYVGRAYYNRRQWIHVSVDRGPGRAPGEKLVTRLRLPDEWIESRVPAILDEETFQRAQQRLTQNKKESSRRTRPGCYLLRGLVRCGRCGHRMKGFRNGARPYYVCPRQRVAASTSARTCSLSPGSAVWRSCSTSASIT